MIVAEDSNVLAVCAKEYENIMKMHRRLHMLAAFFAREFAERVRIQMGHDIVAEENKGTLAERLKKSVTSVGISALRSRSDCNQGMTRIESELDVRPAMISSASRRFVERIFRCKSSSHQDFSLALGEE